MFAISAQRHARSINRLDGGHGLGFDAEDLYQSTDRIAREPEVVLPADFSRVLQLFRRAPEDFGVSGTDPIQAVATIVGSIVLAIAGLPPLKPSTCRSRRNLQGAQSPAPSRAFQ